MIFSYLIFKINIIILSFYIFFIAFNVIFSLKRINLIKLGHLIYLFIFIIILFFKNVLYIVCNTQLSFFYLFKYQFTHLFYKYIFSNNNLYLYTKKTKLHFIFNKVYVDFKFKFYNLINIPTISSE